MTAASGSPSDTAEQLRHLATALKAPRITEAAQRLAEQAGRRGSRAKDDGWLDPALTSMGDPVMYLASFEATDTTARETSDGSSLPTGET